MITRPPEYQPSDLPSALIAPARRALPDVGIQSPAQATARTEREIANPHGAGPEAIRQMGGAMAEQRLGFAKESTTST